MNGSIPAVGDEQFALGVKRDITPTPKLPRTCALAPNAAHMRAITQPEHLHAAVLAVLHGDVALSIARNTQGFINLIGSLAAAADGPNVLAIAAPKHLNGMGRVISVRHNHEPVAVECDAECSRKRPARTLDGAHERPIAVTENFNDCAG